MAHHENSSRQGHFHPGVAIDADYVCLRGWVIRIFVHEFKSHDDSDHGEGAEQDVGEKEYPHLLHEKFLIVAKPVEVARWKIIPVDQIVEIVEDEVKNLLREDEDADCEENRRVHALVARRREVAKTDQADKHAMEEDSADHLDPVEGCVPLVVLLSVARVHDEGEGEEVPIGAKRQIEVHPQDAIPYVLVKDQVDELEALEKEEKFDLGNALLVTIVVDEASDHELHH